MKILAVGDIHTKNWIFDQVEEIIQNYDAVVFCGDYADNWNTEPIRSIASWARLKELHELYPNKVHAVLGNHDYAYLHASIAGRSSGWSPVTYALINSPEQIDLNNWLHTLPIVYELNGITFSHAGVTEEWSGEFDVESLWRENSPIWARPSKYGGSITYKNIPQVIGHNSCEKIWKPAETVWCIDTFSERQDNTPFGDYTVLEITDAKEFNIKKLKTKTNANHNNTTSISDRVS